MQTESAKGWVGSPACGFLGSHAFEFARTAQRGTDGRYNQRRASRRVTPQWRGQDASIWAALDKH
ncbi:MAG: hypothetical protein AUJ20_04780 [Comamonadaceae bacterium CG1_02_60_18]|nr:MAG: hypothetical protein AUJ20_04780 [Comamonadaceae bacterium CG1_02_60_18]